MIDIRKLKELVRLMTTSELTELDLRDKDEQVTIRRPKVRDLRAMEKMREPDGTELDQGIAMAAALCDLPLEAIDEMDAADFAAVSEVLVGFLPKIPA